MFKLSKKFYKFGNNIRQHFIW